MAGLIVSAGAVRQSVGSHQLLQFLLLVGGQQIDDNLTALTENLWRLLRAYWRVAVPSLSGLDPVQPLSTLNRELEPDLAAALPLAVAEVRRLLLSDENVSPFLDYFPDLAGELEDLEYLLANLLRLSRTLRLEMDLTA